MIASVYVWAVWFRYDRNSRDMKIIKVLSIFMFLTLYIHAFVILL